MKEIERLVEERRRILLCSAWGYTLWMSAMIVRDAGFPCSYLSVVSLVGFAFWGWASWQLSSLMQRLRDNPSLRPAFNDERVELARLHAWRTALFLAVGTQAVWMGFLGIFPAIIPAIVVAETSLLVMVVGGIVAFLHYDK